MNIEYFNCGGYALETYEWFEFYTKEDNEEVKSIFEENQELNKLKLDNFKLSNIIMKYLRQQ